ILSPPHWPVQRGHLAAASRHRKRTDAWRKDRRSLQLPPHGVTAVAASTKLPLRGHLVASPPPLTTRPPNAVGSPPHRAVLAVHLAGRRLWRTRHDGLHAVVRAGLSAKPPRPRWPHSLQASANGPFLPLASPPSVPAAPASTAAVCASSPAYVAAGRVPSHRTCLLARAMPPSAAASRAGHLLPSPAPPAASQLLPSPSLRAPPVRDVLGDDVSLLCQSTHRPASSAATGVASSRSGHGEARSAAEGAESASGVAGFALWTSSDAVFRLTLATPPPTPRGRIVAGWFSPPPPSWPAARFPAAGSGGGEGG
ncbi:Os07g0582700, partial [Oryza sativa Japonica Group]